MGQGRTDRTDPARAPSSAAGPEGGPPIDFCERTHRLRFEPSRAELEIGQTLRLQLGLQSPSLLTSSGELAGQLIDPQAPAIESCIERGFRFAGRITALGEAEATLEARGERR